MDSQIWCNVMFVMNGTIMHALDLLERRKMLRILIFIVWSVWNFNLLKPGRQGLKPEEDSLVKTHCFWTGSLRHPISAIKTKRICHLRTKYLLYKKKEKYFNQKKTNPIHYHPKNFLSNLDNPHIKPLTLLFLLLDKNTSAIWKKKRVKLTKREEMKQGKKKSNSWKRKREERNSFLKTR